MRRRDFLRTTLAALASGAAAGCHSVPRASTSALAEPIIDIHQHTHYHGRSDHDLVRHQQVMGATTTVLLPAGKYFGLAAECGGNDTVVRLARKHPEMFRFFANEMPFLAETNAVITEYLDKGGIGIGEQKFRVLADSAYLERIAGIARDHRVPVLLHFWDHDYNMELQRFHKILEKFPSVNFIGHAQTWWGHIDKNYNTAIAYPKGKVTPGGLTDRLLSDYPNMYGDLSAGSGLNALTRDPDHTRAFLEKHQDKLLFGSDCEDVFGAGEKCTGAQIIQAVRAYAPSKPAERKMLYGNAMKLLRI